MFSGQQVYGSTYYITLFAWITNYIILPIAWFNTDIHYENVLKNPKMYHLGMRNQLMNPFVLVTSLLLRAFAYGFVLYFVSLSFFSPVIDLDELGASTYMSLVLVLTLRQSQLALTWTWLVSVLGELIVKLI